VVSGGFPHTCRLTAPDLKGQSQTGLPPPTAETIALSQRKQKLPAGWDEERIRAVIAHDENQAEDEQIAEIEAAWEDPNGTMVAVPTELVPKVQALLARYERTS